MTNSMLQPNTIQQLTVVGLYWEYNSTKVDKTQVVAYMLNSMLNSQNSLVDVCHNLSEADTFDSVLSVPRC